MYTANDHSFVLCAYKENPYLEDALESCLSQIAQGKVIISTSTPNSYIERIARAHAVPVVVNEHPNMLADDWNYGYDACDTALVTVAHQDDIYDAAFVAETLEALNRYPAGEPSIAYTDYYEIRNGEHTDSNRLLNIKRMMNVPMKARCLNGSVFAKRRLLSFGDPICCPSITYVKEKLGPSVFDTRYRNSCDYRTLVDLASKPGRFVYVPKKLMGHRIYEGSATTANLKDDIRSKEDREILESLWPAPIAKAINSVYVLSEKSNELK